MVILKKWFSPFLVVRFSQLLFGGGFGSGFVEGTEITMDCEYTSSYAWSKPYALVAVNDSGDVLQVATWSVGPSGTASINGSVPWQPDQIDRIEIQSTSGTTLLRLEP